MNENPFSRTQLRRVGLVASGNFTAGILGFVLLVLLARGLSPTEFTIVASIIAIIDGGQLFLDAMFNTGIVSVATRDSKYGEPRTAVLRAGLFAKATGGALLAVLLAILAVPMSVGLVGDRSLAVLICLAGIAAALAGMQGFIGCVLQSRGQFAGIALTSTLKNLLRIGLAGPFIFLGDASGHSVALAICAATVIALPISMLLISWDFVRERSPLRGHFVELYKINGWMTLIALSVLGGRLDLWLVGILSDPHQAGLYAVAAQLCIGVGVVTQSLITTYLPTISQLQAATEIRRFLLQWLRCIPFAIIAVAAAWLLSDPFIRLVFGDAYADSAPVFIVLFAASMMTLVGAPLSLLLISQGETHLLAAGTLCQFALRVAFALPAIPSAGALGMALADIASRVIAMTMIGYFIWLALRRSLNRN